MSTAFDRLSRNRLTPRRLAAIYLVFGFFALFVSDVVLVALFEDPLLQAIQGVKGAAEVAVTAGFIFLLVTWSWRDLRRHQRAIDAAPIGITLTDPGREDNPLIFANDQFGELTGYAEREALGRNCRFLQGAETDPETRARVREAIEEERAVTVDIVNYRKNGEKFWNKVDVAPVRDDGGEVTDFVGFQTNITDRKLREERLRVLNRVLRHNFRNKMTVIDGHARLLGDEFDEPPDSLTAIQTAVEDLRSLSERVRENEAVLQAAADPGSRLSLAEPLRALVADFRERYPDASFDLEVPDDVRVRGTGIVWAIEEAIENAVGHNESPEPTVRVDVEPTEDGWVTIEVADDGPGIPTTEVEVLTEGETPLKHGNRIGMWSIHWIANLAGGSMSVEDSDLGGTGLSLSVPDADARGPPGET